MTASWKSLSRVFVHGLLALVVVLGAAQEVLAQRLPVGVFEWEALGEMKMRGTYVFEADGSYRFRVHSDPPWGHAGRWEMRGADVVMHAQDGSEQTYRWQGNELVLVANSTGMPDERVALRLRVEERKDTPKKKRSPAG